ncbi:hypothetical protein J8657_16080 [Dickeya oryzae]|uniref:Uncharacterized protein n=1 Tax=Dickeya oryzae TaxID=1240404 RepID=A0AB39IE53_9GAMM|nr:hypothetical protein [Dickeya oryzae]MBP2859119.1 hypothetical protein [Dickeya oryzae]MCA6996820.1 hypothetical protein [Dickeya oryzae]
MNHEKITKILVVMASLFASYSAMAVSYYGLNDDGMHAAAIIHAFPQTGGFDLYLQDWQRSDNSGTVKVIIEKWKD